MSENKLKNIVTALHTKPFLILAGVSGTGKTQIARIIAGKVGKDGIKTVLEGLNYKNTSNDVPEFKRKIANKFFKAIKEKIEEKIKVKIKKGKRKNKFLSFLCKIENEYNANFPDSHKRFTLLWWDTDKNQELIFWGILTKMKEKAERLGFPSVKPDILEKGENIRIEKWYKSGNSYIYIKGYITPDKIEDADTLNRISNDLIEIIERIKTGQFLNKNLMEV